MVREIPVERIVRTSDVHIINDEDDVVCVLKKVLRMYGLFVPPSVSPANDGTWKVGRGWLLIRAWKEMDMGDTIACEIEEEV